MYQVEIFIPITKETKIINCKTIIEMVQPINDILFNGCDVIKKCQLYNYLQTNKRITQPYYNNIKVTKIMGCTSRE